MPIPKLKAADPDSLNGSWDVLTEDNRVAAIVHNLGDYDPERLAHLFATVPELTEELNSKIIEVRFLADENARLREYVNDNGDRFAAVVKQRDAAEKTLDDLVQQAGELLGTDPEYRNRGTVAALMSHYQWVCKEWQTLLEATKVAGEEIRALRKLIEGRE